MAKRNVQKNRKQKNKPKKGNTSRKGSKMSNSRNPTFGPVSTINTAPVAVGNSLRGSQPIVLQTADGVRVIGRDFGFTPYATGSVAGWALVGGMPLTPACMPSTALRNFLQLYNKFKFNTCNFHYITSSSTSTTGDVMFYYSKNADSSNPNWTSNSFLPFVLSDPYTVIGPQWTNHTITVNPTGPYRSTDYGLSNNQSTYSQGDVYLYSKTSSTESPGYVIFDYDITFKELSVNPRAGLLPLIKAQWQPIAMNFANGAVTTATIAVNTSLNTAFIGGSTITVPAFVIGDVYKIIIDNTNSTYVALTSSNFFVFNAGNISSAFALADGFTLYCVAVTTTTLEFYATDTEAFSGNGGQIKFGASVTLATDILRGVIKCIGSVNPTTMQVQY